MPPWWPDTNAAGQTVITVTLTPVERQPVDGERQHQSDVDARAATATSTAGVACTTTAVTESGAPKRNF